jgi:hypothetical protein
MQNKSPKTIGAKPDLRVSIAVRKPFITVGMSFRPE